MYGYILAALAAALIMYIPFPAALVWLWKRRFRNRIARAGAVSITFDDGPDPAATRPILDLLDSAGVRATFFVTGEAVHAHPGIVREILSRRHEIGEHGYYHCHPWKTGPAATFEDLAKSAGEIGSFGGARQRLFRPPYGKLNLAGLLYVMLTRRRTVFWTIDPEDYRAETPEQVVGFLKARVKPGSVILLHDSRRNGRDPLVTVRALKEVLAFVVGQGFRVMPVGAVLKEAGAGEKSVQAAGN